MGGSKGTKSSSRTTFSDHRLLYGSVRLISLRSDEDAVFKKLKSLLKKVIKQ